MHLHEGNTFTVFFETTGQGSVVERWAAEVPAGTPEDEAYSILQERLNNGDIIFLGQTISIGVDGRKIIPGSMRDAD